MTAKAQATDVVSQRRTPRRTYRRPVGVLVRGRYEVIEGRSLSEGGMALALGNGSGNGSGAVPKLSLELLKTGSKVAVSLILPAGPVIVLRAQVVYRDGDDVSGHVIGIKFDSVPLHQRREIRNYVSAKQAGESDLNDNGL